MPQPFTVKSKFLSAPAILILASAIFLAIAFHYFNYVEDDVFITMHYAQNFVRGHGWVINAGERVEGYTSPLHLWYLTILMRFLSPDQALFATKVLGCILGVVVLRQTQMLARLALPNNRRVGDWCPLLLAVQPAFALSMINGLETCLATAFLTSGVLWSMPAIVQESRFSQRISALFFTAAALTRPEIMLTLPIIWGLYSWRKRKLPDPIACAIYALPLIAEFCFRWSYYGAILPNTYFAKQIPLDVAVPMGFSYCFDYMVPGHSWLGLAPTILGCIGVLRMRSLRILPLLVTWLIQIAFVLRAGGDWMIDGRFYATVSPLFAVVWSIAFVTSISMVAWLKTKATASIVNIGCGAFAIALSGVVAADTTRTLTQLSKHTYLHDLAWVMRPHAPYERWRVGNPQGFLRTSQWISQHARPGETVLTTEMGLVPIQNPQIRFVDACGLTDTTIARLPGYRRGRGGVMAVHEWMDPGPLNDYIELRKPEWVVFMWDQGGEPLTGMDKSSSTYQPSGTYAVQTDFGHFTVATWRRIKYTNTTNTVTARAELH